MRLTKDQQTALRKMQSFDTPMLTLSGPAGTGKTTLIGHYLKQNKHGSVQVSATTHKAAAVLGNKTGVDVSTVHSLFGLRPIQDYSTGKTRLVKKNKGNLVPFSTVVVDEASMIDREMLSILREEASNNDSKLLFVGDSYQLPPVADNDETPVVFDETPVVSLKKIVRQAADNPIIEYASQIRSVLDGKPYPKLPESDYIKKVDQSDFMTTVQDFYNSAAYQADPDHCRVLAWTNKTVIAWNRHIRQMLLGPDARKYEYVPGERLVSNKPVLFGEQVVIPNEATVTVENAEPGSMYGLHGHFLDVDFDGSVFKRLFVPRDHSAMRANGHKFANKAKSEERKYGPHSEQKTEAWKKFFEYQDRMCDFRSGYASTIHKAQGSTYQHAIIHGADISRATGHMLARLMYVAVTRAAQTATIHLP